MPSRPASSATQNDATSITKILIFSVVILVACLLLGDYWLQQTRTQEAAIRQQAEIYETYRENTRPSDQPPQLSEHFIQAQQTKEKLLNHPAVTPGAGFDKPGVQSTGLAIVEAIDQAKASPKQP